jgi:hypothetical protein
MSPSHLSELLELIDEAAAEIVRLDGHSNPIGERLRTVQRRYRPLRTTIGELATRTDLPARDVLDAVVAGGVQIFWHEGQQFRSPSSLRTYLAMTHFFDPLVDVEFELTADQSDQLAAEWGLDFDPLASDRIDLDLQHADESEGKRARRKFAASERSLSSAPTAERAKLG